MVHLTEPGVKETRESPPIGENTGFQAIVREHWTPVYRLLYKLSGRVEEAEDLTQETFLRALTRFDTFQPGTRLRSWLLRIASNAFFDECRKRKRIRLELPMDELTDATPAAGHDLETAEQAALVRAAMEELTERTRLVFHLRAQEDLSFREVAKLAGTTEQAARWHMHRARTKLLARLGDRM